MNADTRPIMLNLWAPPGVGKSATAAMVFNVLKYEGHRAELSLEFAKDVTYERSWKTLKDQFYVAAQQEHRNHRLIGEVDIIVTDSPPGMGLVYCPLEDVDMLRDCVMHWRCRYRNVDWLLLRDEERVYQRFGRTQTLEESDALYPQVIRHLSRVAPTYKQTRADKLAAVHIADHLMRRIQRGHI